MDILELRALSEIILSILLTPAMLLFYPLFLFWIPLLHLASSWTLAIAEMPRELNFVQTYMELVLVVAFFVRWLAGRKDRVSVWLLGLAVLCLPSLVNAGDGEHFFFSLVLFSMLLCSPGVYGLFLDKMKWFMKRYLVEWTVLLWVALGLVAKWYLSVKYSALAVFQRGGSIWGSNHVAGILLLLLPLVKKQWVLAVAVAFLLSHFSLGIYLALAILVIGWFLVGSHRRVLVAILGSAILITIIFVSVPALFQPALEFLKMRFGMAAVESGTLIEGLTQRVLGGERWEIWSAALEIAYQSRFIGVGLGGFYWGLEGIGSNLPLYSNAHNTYLTALAEGGLLFAVGFVCLLLFALRRAYSVSKPVFIGLLAWMFYGLYSGQIYEASRFASAGDYYNLMFVLAYLSHMKKMQHMPETNADQTDTR